MANSVSVVNFASSYATFSATAVSNGTYGDVIGEDKFNNAQWRPDERWANTIDDFVKTAWPLLVIAAAASAWETVYELDWLAENYGTVSTNGNISVDGKNWTSANYLSATLFTITTSNGLKITSATGLKTWTTTTQDAPSLRINLSTLAAVDYTAGIEVWSYFTTATCPASSNAIIAGIYAAATGAYTATILGGGFLHNGAAVYPYQQRGTTFTANAAVATTYNVIVWRYENGVQTCYAGTWSAGWPERSALVHVATDVQPEGSAIVTLATIQRANAQLIYCPATRSASGAPALALARTRIMRRT